MNTTTAHGTAVERAHLFPRSTTASYPVVARAEGVYLWDQGGKRYLDGSSGAVVVTVGHGRSEVIDAMYRQASTVAFAHTSQFTNLAQEELASLVAAATGLQRAFFTSSGSEAVEAAIKLARQYHVERGRTGKTLTIGRWSSYHGATLGALAVGGNVGRRRPFEPLLLDQPHIAAPYCYRCPFSLTYPGCRVACADALEEAIEQAGPERVSAFIAEPIIGAAGGAIVPPEEYYPRLREICRRHDVLMIADEVMSGGGRTGRYLAIEHWGVEPDLVVLGKGLASGYAPLAGVVASADVYETIVGGSGQLLHGQTFFGHPVSCAAGVAVQRIVHDEQLAERAASVGAGLRARLEELARRSHVIGEVRGRGLLLALELVDDRAVKRPFPPEARAAERLRALCFDLGLIVYPGNRSHEAGGGEWVLVAPPLTISDDETSELIELLESGLRAFEREQRPSTSRP